MFSQCIWDMHGFVISYLKLYHIIVLLELIGATFSMDKYEQSNGFNKKSGRIHHTFQALANQ